MGSPVAAFYPQYRSHTAGTRHFIPRLSSSYEEDDSPLSQSIAKAASAFQDRSIDDIQRLLVEKGQRATDYLMPVDECDDTVADLQRVSGCVAHVELQTHLTSDQLVHIKGTADALLSRGLLAVVAGVVHLQSPDDVLAWQPTLAADHLGLRSALSRGRNDGLASMITVMQQQIKSLLGETATEDEASTIEVTKSRPTVALLLSGGVDSSVALNLLVRDGYDVTAFYLRIWLEDELAHLGQCPWEEDYRMCEAVCAQAGVPLETISLQSEYKERVIAYTIGEAEQGRTPNPDILCNSRIKFGCFYDAIAGRGFDHVATGHYAQVIDGDNGHRSLLRAPDPIKDQSYFLCALNQEQLSKVLFPIGHMAKSRVRELAEEFQLPNRHRPDSQGLCFLGKVKFDDFLAAYLGERPGDIVDAATGEVIGRHKGVWYHTVGQRKGIGKVLDPLATSRGPWYVVAKDPLRDVIYCSNAYDESIFEAARSQFTVESIGWIRQEPPTTSHLDMKIRHGPKIVSGTLQLPPDDPTQGDVQLDQKDGGLAPGQYVVFYDGEECLGGGVISERHWAKFLLDRKSLGVANATLT